MNENTDSSKAHLKQYIHFSWIRLVFLNGVILSLNDAI